MGYIVNSWLTVSQTSGGSGDGTGTLSNVEFTALPNYGRNQRECTVVVVPYPNSIQLESVSKQIVQEGSNLFISLQDTNEDGELEYISPPDGAREGELFILGYSNSPTVYVMQADDTDTPIVTDATYMYYSYSNYGYSLDEWHKRFNNQESYYRNKVYKGTPNLPNQEDLGESDRYYFIIPLGEIPPDYYSEKEFNLLVSSSEDFSDYSIVRILQTSSFDQM